MSTHLRTSLWIKWWWREGAGSRTLTFTFPPNQSDADSCIPPPLTPHSRTPSRPAALPCRCVINILEILDILKQHPNIQV